MQDPKKLEEYAEAKRKFASRLTLEERLAGLTPAQRLADLTPEQMLLAMPDDILRGLSDAYLRSLPSNVQDAIRARIGRPGAQDSCVSPSSSVACLAP